MTRIDSPKISEIARDPNVLLSYSEPKDQNYVSLSGKAEVVRDTAKVKELWSEFMRTWFPHGPEESDVALIKVTTESAEYWDSPSSALVYAYGYAKARLTGESPKMSEKENAVVCFESERKKKMQK
ncbi:MAG: pyridoxamine 5'-phosphate oxidase family protein [Rickettsiales bacterium]